MPTPSPSGLVVKKETEARAITSGFITVPVSHTIATNIGHPADYHMVHRTMRSSAGSLRLRSVLVASQDKPSGLLHRRHRQKGSPRLLLNNKSSPASMGGWRGISKVVRTYTGGHPLDTGITTLDETGSPRTSVTNFDTIDILL